MVVVEFMMNGLNISMLSLYDAIHIIVFIIMEPVITTM